MGRFAGDITGKIRFAARPITSRLSAGQQLALLIIALLAARLLLYALVAGAYKKLPADLCLWDCNWFLGTEQSGYNLVPNIAAGPTHGQANWVNFPVFPGLIYLVKKLLGTPDSLAGFIVANASLGIFVFMSVKYLEIVSSARDRLAVVLFLLAYPYGFYFSLTYTEATYAAVSMATFYLFARRRITTAAFAASLLSVTRVTGVLFAPIIAAHYLVDAFRAWRGQGWRAAGETIIDGILPVALAPLGLFLYMFYLYIHAGDAFGFLHVQRAWGRSEMDPIIVLYNGVFANDLGTNLAVGKQSQTFATICAFAGLLLCGWLLFLKRWGECWFLFASLMIALSAGLLSFPRYCLTNPIMILYLFELIRRCMPRWLFVPLLVLCAALQLLLVHLWLGRYDIFV